MEIYYLIAHNQFDGRSDLDSFKEDLSNSGFKNYVLIAAYARKKVVYAVLPIDTFNAYANKNKGIAYEKKDRLNGVYKSLDVFPCTIIGMG